MKQIRSILLTLAFVSLLIFAAVPNIRSANAIASITVVVSPIQQTADATLNQFAYYSVLVQSVGGFVGTVTLNASITAGPITTQNPVLSFPGGSTVDVPLDGQAFSYLLATVGGGVAIGDYTIRVRAQAPSGIYSDGTTILRVIQYVAGTPDFRLSSTPGTIIDVVPGGAGALQINIQGYAAGATVQTVALLLAPSIPGLVSATFDPAIVSVTDYLTSNSLLLVTTTTLTPAGNYTLVITGSSDTGVIHSWAVTLRVNGFYIAPSPMSKSVIQGKSATFNIGVVSVGTFSSTVTLTAIGVPLGMTASFNPVAVLPPQSGVSSSILTVATTPSLAQGTYFVTIRGTSGTLQSQQSIAISVGDFDISVTPASKTVEQNSSATFLVTGSSSDDYSAAMSLAVSGVPTGVIATFTPTSVLIPPAGSNSSTMSLSVSPTAPTGTYTLNVTGTSGSQSHMTSVTLVIVQATDFTLTLVPSSSVTVRNGSSTTVTININSINSFTSPVTLTVSLPSGSGVTGSINPPTVSPPPNGIGTATLTLTAAATAPPGTGTITVNGVSGTKTRVTTGSLTISPTAGRPCIIATATYGSELAPEVYFLRLFRDQSVQTTFAGREFMNVFNAWYYSFSPGVAEQVKNNLLLRNVVKAVLYPLIGTLYLAQWTYSSLSFAPELAVVVTGLVASSLIGLVYFTPIAVVAAELLRRKRITAHSMNKTLALAWLASMALILVAELSSVSLLMMFATAAFVLSTIAITMKTVATQTQRIFH